MKTALFLVLTSTILVSCEKEEEEEVESLTTQSINKSTSNNNKNNNEITYILEENFDIEFESFAETFFTEHPYGLINFEYYPESLQYSLTTEDLGPKDPVSGARVVCRGERSSVVACATRYSQHNAFGCIPSVTRQYYGDGSGRYVYRADVADSGGC